jgi:hypothetical protein
MAHPYSRRGYLKQRTILLAGSTVPQTYFVDGTEELKARF